MNGSERTAAELAEALGRRAEENDDEQRAVEERCYVLNYDREVAFLLLEGTIERDLLPRAVKPEASC